MILYDYMYTHIIFHLSSFLMINELMQIPRTYNPKPEFQRKIIITSQFQSLRFFSHCQ